MEEHSPEDNLKREILSWRDIDKLIDHLMPQFRGEFDGLLMITKGGLIPGGILSEAMGIRHVLTATVHFPDEVNPKLAWPIFAQFPEDILVVDRRILVVDDVWANGRAIMTVRSRLQVAGCHCEVAVLHYRQHSNLFSDAGPEYYGAITDRYLIYPWESSFLPPSHRAKPGTGPLSPI
jgi:hypothetical protein